MVRLITQLSLLILISFLSVSRSLRAQPLFILEQENIDMALTRQYEKALQSTIVAMHAAGLGPEHNWQASQHGSTYYFISELPSTSQQTQTRTARLSVALDKTNYDLFRSLTEAAIRTRYDSVLEHASEYSYTPAKPIDKAHLNYVDIVQVHAEQVMQFRNATTQTIKALKVAGYPIGFTVYQIIVGNPNPQAGPSYYLVSPYHTRSEFYEEHPLVVALQRALGNEEATRLLLGQQKNLITGQSFDHSRRADLSYQARIKR